MPRFSKLFLNSLTALQSFKECVHSLLHTLLPALYLTQQVDTVKNHLEPLLSSYACLCQFYQTYKTYNKRKNLANEEILHDTTALTQLLFVFLYHFSSRLYVNNCFVSHKIECSYVYFTSLLDITLRECFKWYYIHNWPSHSGSVSKEPDCNAETPEIQV